MPHGTEVSVEAPHNGIAPVTEWNLEAFARIPVKQGTTARIPRTLGPIQHRQRQLEIIASTT
jgi:hypothetical protein